VSDNILSRPGHLLAQALKQMPAADRSPKETAETIDVPGIGAVRVVAQRMKATRGKVSHHFWTAVKAAPAK
jgi:hypothetical protein